MKKTIDTETVTPYMLHVFAESLNATEGIKAVLGAAPEVDAVPVAWRLTNTSYRKTRFEYFKTKEEAEQRQADFNRSVDDGGLYNLTALYTHPPADQYEHNLDMVERIRALKYAFTGKLFSDEISYNKAIDDVIKVIEGAR